MDYTFQVRIRQSHIARFFLLPIIRLQRSIEYRSYLHRGVGDNIKSCRNRHKDNRCFIIGNGPSLSADDLNMIKDEYSFAFNSIFHIYSKTLWRPTYYMVTDKALINSFLTEPIPDLQVKEAFVFSKKLAKYWCNNMYVNEIFLKGRIPSHRETYYNKKISEDVSDCFSASQSVIINAFELAFYMGFSEIILIGVDHSFNLEMDMDGRKKTNKVLSHFKEDKDQCTYMTYKEALTKCYETCAKYAQSKGIKIYNATRGGKLEVFERINLEQAINKKMP